MAERSLRRVLRVLKVQEEHAQAALESTLGQLRQIENALNFAIERERAGRELIGRSAQSGDAEDRHAALEETAASGRKVVALRPRQEDAERDVVLRREAFLARRLARRQVEELIREADARQAVNSARRQQQSMYDRYLGRLAHRDSPEKKRECESGHAIPKRT